MRLRKQERKAENDLKKRTFNWLVTEKLYSISKAAKAMLLTDEEADAFSMIYGVGDV